MAIIYHLCSSLIPDAPFANLFPYVPGRQINQPSLSETWIALYPFSKQEQTNAHSKIEFHLKGLCQL